MKPKNRMSGTPIASITAMLEAIEDGLAEPEEYLAPLQDQVRRLGALVEDLFELARIDAGALAHELRATQLAALVESCVRGLEAEARARNVRLEQRIDTTAPTVRCAPEQVERVLLNLLTNALRHTPSDGTVAVILASERDRVRVTVEDSGEGIPAGTERRIFDRFWRGDSARTGGATPLCNPAAGVSHRNSADCGIPRAVDQGNVDRVDHRLCRADSCGTADRQCHVSADGGLSADCGPLLRVVLADIACSATARKEDRCRSWH